MALLTGHIALGGMDTLDSNMLAQEAFIKATMEVESHKLKGNEGGGRSGT